MKRFVSPLLATALLLVLAACPAPPREGLPNIVVITLDTTRADHLGLYDYIRDTSPRLDAFGAQAIVFDHALAPMATTLPTHASLFTGLYPLEHGALANLGHGGSRLETSDALTSLAVEARDAGYSTAGFVSSAPLKRGSGVATGFDTFTEPGSGEVLRTGDTTTDDALTWLNDQQGKPYFLFVHYFDAHWPFTNPGDDAQPFHTDRALDEWIASRQIAASSHREGVGPEQSRAAHNAYDRALRFQDSQLGRLLDALAARDDWDRTSVVIVGDHGEGLSQHGHAAHGRTWNEQLRVPLVLRVPGEAPRRVPTLTSVVDVLPTLLARIDAPELEAITAQASGHDVLTPRNGGRAIFAQDTGRVRDRPGYRFALTTERWKYFRSEDEADEQLYDRIADPFELVDVADQHPTEVRQLSAALDVKLATQHERAAALRGDAAPPTRAVDPELRQQLQQLGYLDDTASNPPPPNVLFVVWDTVRADHLSLYGHERATTPELDTWARDARVFENVMSSASSTVPTHASLFTGLLPSEHGAHAANQWLDSRFDTLAEKFQRAGYRTFLWASNPHISTTKNFAQGFDREEHPWDPEYRERARQLIEEKQSTGAGTPTARQKARLAQGDATWPLAAAGALAADGLERFIAGSESKPWFAFLNYMEAHRPYLPSGAHRRAFMNDAQLARSYAIEATWPRIWSHVFDVQRFSRSDLDVMEAMYDASLRDLDGLFANLRARLAARGELENTIVVLTADHGELLGEHGLLDHQYSLYQPLIGVPLVLWAPGRVESGRDDTPVMALDIYPTLLALAGIETGGTPTLLRSPDDRVRLAEYPAIFSKPFQSVASHASDATVDRFRRRLRAVSTGTFKLIEGEDGKHELYDVSRDPGEARNLAEQDPETRERLRGVLYEKVRGLIPPQPSPDPAAEGAVSDTEAQLLAELGYAEDARSAAERPPSFAVESSWRITPTPRAEP